VAELPAVALLSAAPAFFVVLFFVEVAEAESVFFFFLAFAAVLESGWL
jgi:hypothetical protein